ncbi:short-chain dehydrogenase/reductase [Massariosphaeria phaeospora]|uniref:Short-chain dehydrogenase/reductase n=1 Tax=Massariosphaeria phaeospora TaxID=100035 RepID=A0A7C8I4W3_9PLEO|nr:short-chain dehydrogenase/reductase [Massariosphaeria phaeospora]
MAALKKSVLITGCSAGGIGAGLADVFREKGYHVFATLRNPSKLPSTLSKASNVTPLTLDVLSPDSIANAVSDVTRHTGGRLDILINNSGQNLIRPALDVSLDEGRKLFDLNFWAPLAMIQAFAPLLIEARGCVVNQSSAAAYVPMAFSSIYNSSKAALAMGSEIWRREFEPLGVRTITLITTSVKTPAFERIEKPHIHDSSYYFVIREYLERLADGRLQEGAPDARTYALKVLAEIERGATGEIWVGKDAGMNRFAVKWFPQMVFELILDGFLKASGELAKVGQVMKTRR